MLVDNNKRKIDRKPVCFLFAWGWKLFSRVEYVWPGTADLSLGGLKGEIDAYEALCLANHQGEENGLLDKLFN